MTEIAFSYPMFTLPSGSLSNDQSEVSRTGAPLTVSAAYGKVTAATAKPPRVILSELRFAEEGC